MHFLKFTATAWSKAVFSVADDLARLLSAGVSVSMLGVCCGLICDFSLCACFTSAKTDHFQAGDEVKIYYFAHVK